MSAESAAKGEMKHLSGLDASFLYLETAQMPMHVGSLALYALPPGFEGRWIDALRKHLKGRLPLVPALRQRLRRMPLNMANPVWVDAQPDVARHIVGVGLPPGSGMAALQAKVGQLHSQLLDRRRPLWKFFVFENLAPGPEGEVIVAVYSQLHHAAVDGQAAVALANALYDLTPAPRALPRGAARQPRRFRLGTAQMVSGALVHEVQQIAQMARLLPDTLRTLGGAARQALERRSAVRNLTLAPRTRLNASVGDRRAFATLTLPLPQLKALAKAHDATLNDLVLWLVAGGLRRRLIAGGELPRKPLIAAVPVSLRAQGDVTSDNQVSISAVSLGTHLAGPLQRLAHVKEATAAMKAAMGSVKSILPTDFPSLGVPWLMEAAAALYGRARIADRIPQLANVAVSNVPGPPVPLYLAGARLLAAYPTSIVVHGIGLNVTVQSYDAGLHFGLMACADAMPDVDALAGEMRQAFDELALLTPPVAKATTRTGRSPKRRAAAASPGGR